MCGIAGIFSISGVLPSGTSASLEAMGRIQAHRGPDDAGAYLSERCGFAFRRLSILDVARGHQPMISPRTGNVIVFNGEIYNFKQLRPELQRIGFAFETDSDTEVLLASYDAWGAGMVHKLRGMFAFAIFDRARCELFAARDHTGIKPFYYCASEGLFLFASEAKALFETPHVRASLNIEVLPKYMSFLWVPAPETMFEGVSMLEPGHALKVSGGGISKERYWNPSLAGDADRRHEAEWIELIDHELGRSVREQLISDVPLGAFLSGGVDSSLIVAYMNRLSSARVTTYTTGFRSQDMARDVIMSDLKYARIASKALNVDYNELILDPDVVDLLPRLVWHMDEPVADPAAITTYLICRASKNKATVMLSGVGGDEVFGGYPRYLAAVIAEKYRRIPAAVRKGMIEPVLNILPAGSSAFARNARKFIRSADMDFRRRYLGYLTYYSESSLRSLLKMRFEWNNVSDTHMRILDAYSSGDMVRDMMNLDLMTFLPNLNLMYTDKMSSAASVEVRVPLLDHRLIEIASGMPSSLKLRGWTRKYLFKKLAEKSLPHEVVWRKKAGFGAPIGAWLKGQAREMLLDLLSEDTVTRRGLFEPGEVRRMIDGHMSGREYNANQLWQLMTLELWQREFLDSP